MDKEFRNFRAKKKKPRGYTDYSIAFFDQLMRLKVTENGDNGDVYNLGMRKMILLEEFVGKATDYLTYNQN